MRLIDADALIDDIKNHLWDWETVNGITAQTVLRQTITDIENQPTVNPWHRVEEPPQSGKKCFTAYRSILRNDTEWLYDICYYTDDLARDCPLMDGAEHMPGWYRYESEYGDVECHPKYWMPIEPPKEDA